MRLISLTILITAGILSPWLVHACSQPQVETSFDTVAPTTTDIVAVQVESLALESDPFWHRGVRPTQSAIVNLRELYCAPSRNNSLSSCERSSGQE